MVRFFPNAKYKFIEKRRVTFRLFAIVAALAIGFGTYYHFTKGSWLNYGVDFAGGTLLQVRFTEPVDVAEVRAAVAPQFQGTEITRFGGENEVLLRAPRFSQGGTATADAIKQVLTEKYGNKYQIMRTEAVGPKVGSELQTKALLAIILSFAATLIYLAFRFEWRFGAATIIATLHDITWTLAMIIIFRMEVSLTTVAALLTIVGYSMNDTIVIFDRVRENLKRAGHKHTDLMELLNRSINETLPRTTLTASTTMATLLSLAILGGEALRSFAIIMIFGILVGTYSSMFIGAPMLYEIEKKWRRQIGAKTGSRQSRVAL
jgi:preprotein translocase subunit SecF